MDVNAFFKPKSLSSTLNKLPIKSTSINKRIFLVGSGRCGSTLLQGLIWAHPEIYSCPETHFFQSLQSNSRINQVLGISDIAHDPICNRFLSYMIKEHQLDIPDTLPRNITERAQAFVHLMDMVAVSTNNKYWLEKTPGHLHEIEHIKQYVENVVFIHLVRSGTDTVASLWDTFRKFNRENPDWEEAKYSKLDDLAHNWVDAVNISMSYLSDPQHCVLRYGDLVANTEAVMHRICEFIQIDYNDSMLNNYTKTTTHYNEPWHEKVGNKITNYNNSKFYEVFTPAQQALVSSIVNEVDLSRISTS